MNQIKIFNTLTKQKDEFKPIVEGEVKIYNCGPTVYSHQHIGNLYSSCFADFLRRMFEYQGYKVTQVMNITDVGHLVSEDDAGKDESGEDKMEKGAKKEGLTVWDVAKKYTDLFLADTKKMNIKEPEYRPKATEYIKQMIEMVQQLEEKGFTYETEEAVYFDVSKFPEYGNLSGQKLEDKITGAREDVFVDGKKRNNADFALWFKRVGRFANHTMHWESPWGDGFPGWHIECSAMSKSLLGEHFDIHTGGVEHIPVHHSNEIAQSECANGTVFVNYWMHHQLILVEGRKMSKSIGNIFTLDDLINKGFEPLALRLLYLQTKYREQMNFTLEALQAAQNSINSIRKTIRELVSNSDKSVTKAQKKDNQYQKDFEEALSDDLNTPIALSIFFKLLKDNSIDPIEKLEQLFSFDEVLGLKLNEIKPIESKPELEELKKLWNKAREEKNWEVADKLRDRINSLQM
jgi:cysteinyl-tRNA synthetase